MDIEIAYEQYPLTRLTEALDDFIELNDRAMQFVAAIGDNAINGLRHGRRISLGTDYAQLQSAVHDMIEFLESVHRRELEEFQQVKNKFAEVDGILASNLSALEMACNMGYAKPVPSYFDFNLHGVNAVVQQPFKKALYHLAGGSKPQVTPATIETMEELIRLVHEWAIDGVENRFYSVSEHLRRHEGIFYAKKAKVTIVGPQIGSMHPVLRAVTEYFNDAEDTKLQFTHASITSRSFSAHAPIGHHHAFFHVLTNQAGTEYRVKFSMNEPGYGNGRIKYCGELFPKLGFTATQGFNHHTAVANVRPAYVNMAIKATFFVAENIAGIDIDTPRYPAEYMAAIFNMLYRHWMVNHDRQFPDREFDQQRYEEKLQHRTSWTERERQILHWLVADPFPMVLQEKNFLPEWQVRNQLEYLALAQKPLLLPFLAEKIHYFFPKGATLSQAKDLYAEAASVLFRCFDFRTYKFQERGQVLQPRVFQPIPSNRDERQQVIDHGFNECFIPVVANSFAERGESYSANKVIPLADLRDAFKFRRGYLFYTKGPRIRSGF